MKTYSTISHYISAQPKAVQPILRKIRSSIKKAAPLARERISYGMPAFDMKKTLVYFAAFKDHISFFPTGAGVKAFKKELTAYDTSKGTIRFSYDKKIPFGLIAKIVKYRVKQQKG